MRVTRRDRVPHPLDRRPRNIYRDFFSTDDLHDLRKDAVFDKIDIYILIPWYETYIYFSPLRIIAQYGCAERL